MHRSVGQLSPVDVPLAKRKGTLDDLGLVGHMPVSVALSTVMLTWTVAVAVPLDLVVDVEMVEDEGHNVQHRL